MSTSNAPCSSCFFEQRQAAKQRGIEWALDFWQWLEIWQASGHLHQRGRCRGQFQMCRLGDIGPYASSNVRIDRMEANASEAQAAKQRIRLARQEAACACKITLGTAQPPRANLSQKRLVMAWERIRQYRIPPGIYPPVRVIPSRNVLYIALLEGVPFLKKGPILTSRLRLEAVPPAPPRPPTGMHRTQPAKSKKTKRRAISFFFFLWRLARKYPFFEQLIDVVSNS